MFAVSSSSTTSVTVPSVRSGFNYQFDTAYSPRLNGLISPEEFRNSMERINSSSKTILGWVTGLIGAALIILGMILFIYGGTHMGFGGFPPEIFVGMGFFLGGGIFLAATRAYLARMMTQRLTDAIAKENNFYSSRQIAWRLHAILAGALVSNRGYVRAIYDYEIEIETNRPDTAVVVPVSNFSVTNYTQIPPSYQQGYQPEYQPPAYVPSQPQQGYQPPQQGYQPPQQGYQPPGVVNTYTQPYQVPPQGYQPPQSSDLQLCPGCQHKLKTDEKFCSQCGFRVTAI